LRKEKKCPYKIQDGRNVYFVVNNSPNAYSGNLTFSAAGVPEVWNPRDGTIKAVRHEQRENKTTITMTLEGFKGYFIIFGKED